MNDHTHDVTRSPYYFKPPKKEEREKRAQEKRALREQAKREKKPRVYGKRERTTSIPAPEKAAAFLANAPHLQRVCAAAEAAGLSVSLIEDQEGRIRPYHVTIDMVIWEIHVVRTVRKRACEYARITFSRTTLPKAAVHLIYIDTDTYHTAYAFLRQELAYLLFTAFENPDKKHADLLLRLPQDPRFARNILDWPFVWQTPAT